MRIDVVLTGLVLGGRRRWRWFCDGLRPYTFTCAVCEKLAEDAAQTTLMVVGFQNWYLAHKNVFKKGLSPFLD